MKNQKKESRSQEPGARMKNQKKESRSQEPGARMKRQRSKARSRNKNKLLYRVTKFQSHIESL